MLPAHQNTSESGSWIAPKATSAMNQMNQHQCTKRITVHLRGCDTSISRQDSLLMASTPQVESHLTPILWTSIVLQLGWNKRIGWNFIDVTGQGLTTRPVTSHTAKISKVFNEQQGSKNRICQCSRGVVLGVLLNVLYWRQVSLPKCHPWWVPPSYLQNLFPLRTLDGKVLLLSTWKTSCSNLSLRERLTLNR